MSLTGGRGQTDFGLSVHECVFPFTQEKRIDENSVLFESFQVLPLLERVHSRMSLFHLGNRKGETHTWVRMSPVTLAITYFKNASRRLRSLVTNENGSLVKYTVASEGWTRAKLALKRSWK